METPQEEFRMRYLLFVCTDPSAEPYDPAEDTIEEWVSHYDSKGTRVVGHRLTGVDKAVTVRVRKGQRLITDGPFAETKEWIPVSTCSNARVSIRPSRSRRDIP
jgi:hypothetical protein